MMADYQLSNLIEGKPISITKNGLAICLARSGNEVFAMEDNCSHNDALLSEGEQHGEKIECWLHGAEFDMRTGEALTPPAISPVKVFKVEINGDDLTVLA